MTPICPASYTPEGVELRKTSLLAEWRHLSAILFNHSFEHVPDPREVLGKARNPAGTGRVRCRAHPLADSFAFFHYGPDWVSGIRPAT